MAGTTAAAGSTSSRILAWGVPRMMVVAAAIAFCWPVVLLATGVGRTDPGQWAAVLVPLACWGLAWRLPPSSRPVGLALAMLAVVPAALLVSAPAGGAWLITVHVAIAVVVSATLALPPCTAVLIVALTALVQAVAGFVPSGSGVLPEPAGSLPLDVIYVVAVGCGLVAVRRSWIAAMDARDARIAALRDAVGRELAADARTVGRLEGERRVHETVLNTLAGLAGGVAPENRDLARADAAATLRRLDDLDDPVPTWLSAVVDAATASVPGITCQVQVDGDVVLAPEVATALRDAIAESLRNVDRHAGVREARVEASAERLRVDVVDEGVGIDADTAGRYGLAESVGGGLRAVGGSALVDRDQPRGTRVVLSVPAPSGPVAAPPPAGTELLDSWPSRVGLVAGAVVLVVAVWPFARHFVHPVLMAVPVLAAALGPFVLAGLWSRTTIRRRSAAALLVLSCAALVATAAAVPVDCGAATAVDWTVGVLCSVCALLPVLALSSAAARGLAVLALASSSAFLVQQLPDACRVRPSTSILSALAYLLLATWLMSWLDSGFAAQGRREHHRWDELVRDRAQADRRRAALTTLGQVPGDARALLVEVACGVADPSSPQVADRAAGAAVRVRAALRGTGPEPLSGPTGALRSVADLAAATGRRVDAVVLDSPTRADGYPPGVTALIAAVLAGSGEAVQVVVTVGDEVETVVMTVPGPASAVTPEGTEDCVVDVVQDRTSTTVVVERPAYGTSPSSRAT